MLNFNYDTLQDLSGQWFTDISFKWEDFCFVKMDRRLVLYC